MISKQDWLRAFGNMPDGFRNVVNDAIGRTRNAAAQTRKKRTGVAKTVVKEEKSRKN